MVLKHLQLIQDPVANEDTDNEMDTEVESDNKSDKTWFLSDRLGFFHLTLAAVYFFYFNL